jgi:hypothetical protein
MRREREEEKRRALDVAVHYIYLLHVLESRSWPGIASQI